MKDCWNYWKGCWKDCFDCWLGWGDWLLRRGLGLLGLWRREGRKAGVGLGLGEVAEAVESSGLVGNSEDIELKEDIDRPVGGSGQVGSMVQKQGTDRFEDTDLASDLDLGTSLEQVADRAFVEGTD